MMPVWLIFSYFRGVYEAETFNRVLIITVKFPI
jgi:hypothetical protein